jgi:ubiquinone/menaquinone biosynthesis C-methylase UbiE
MNEPSINSLIGEVWDKKTRANSGKGQNWWQCKQVHAHIGRKINGSFIDFIRHQVGDRKFERGVSVGCGIGTKEFKVLEAGVVEHFDLFELSRERIASGEARATASGWGHRASFHHADAFAREIPDGSYDLVHWNNSLHHMLDVGQALAWSRRVLAPGGVFVMDDFVGPSRFQWSPLNLELASSFRTQLPQRLLRRPSGEGFMSTRIKRKTIQQMIDMDPSEAADSERILPCLKEVFPAAKVVLTGGAIYHLAMAGIYANLDLTNDEDRRVLGFALLLDDAAMHAGESHYAVAVAFR